ncbi:DUF421 domain-containing protein [Virgibacillus sp. C22-A2]|uniref:DUF421 domain-containing protein n=1 Tax=Virgibacillus tibetensis TaxID=3042313 RepID=A0ABU6KKY0_9BACI|nr:DUF421 domain-containing protein [Virgibacillus sp. C22-A2]
MDVYELLLRIILSFLVLFTLARIMGRKEISQMTFFNFVSAISIGSIAASLAINQNLSIRNGIIALAGWAVFTIAMGFIDIKYKRARIVTTGQPVIVIKDGKIMDNALRKTRLDMDALNSLLRQNNVFSLSEVDYAVFETSGNLSVRKTDSKQTVTKEDMNIMNTKPNVYFASTEVISDGIINTKNLSKLHLDTNWLKQKLHQAGIQTPSEVFYAEVQQDGTLYIDNKDDLVH